MAQSIKLNDDLYWDESSLKGLSDFISRFGDKVSILTKYDEQFPALLPNVGDMAIIFAQYLGTGSCAAYAYQHNESGMAKSEIFNSGNFTTISNSAGTVVVRYNGSTTGVYAIAIKY